MTEDTIEFHETQHLLNDYNHLEPGDESGVDSLGEYAEFLVDQYDSLSSDLDSYWRMNEQVGRGRQGTKWRVKYKRALARRDQVDQVFSELQGRGYIDDGLELD